jgi:putative ABC transport system permease protein
MSRKLATTVAALGLLTAILGFIVLASTSQTAQTVLKGDIEQAWDTPYDLLVRPPDSRSDLEKSQRLIRPNFISGLYGGITRQQLESIRKIPEVTVAAPVAVVGFVNWPSELFLPLKGPQRGSDLAIYRVRTTSTAQAGLSNYPIETRYIVVASKGTLDITLTEAPNAHDVSSLKIDGKTIECTYPSVTCFAPRECFLGRCGDEGAPPSPQGYSLLVMQPIVIAGIDPVSEAKVAGLDRCVAKGRYLRPEDPIVDHPDADLVSIPVLMSQHAFADERFDATIARAIDPSPFLHGKQPSDLSGYETLGTQSRTADDLYRAFLPQFRSSELAPFGFADPYPIWSVGSVGYTGTSTALTAETRTPPERSIYDLVLGVGVGVGDLPPRKLIPPEAKDIAFRAVHQHTDGYDVFLAGPDSKWRLKNWQPVGFYDPACLPGFSELAGGAGLEAYSAPAVRLSDGRLLGPTRSMADYVNSPPLVLTNLRGARWLDEPQRYVGQPGDRFISLIRVKVAGVEEPNAISKARLALVASDIQEATGLQVDIVKGSSTKAVQVQLPAGRYGRPAVEVTEGWSLKGVAIRFVRAVSAQNVALFTLVLFSAVVLVGQTAFLSVRRRRSEFGVLRSLGWPAGRVAELVLVETVLLGLVVGAVALVLELPVALALGQGSTAPRLTLALPLAVGIAAIAAIVPAIGAARGSPIEVIRGRSRVRRSRVPWAPLTLGLRELAGPWRSEAALGAGAIALGSFILGGIVLMAAGFRGRLDTTVLGSFLSTRVAPFHVAIAILTLLIAAISTGEIVTLGYLERRTHLAALRALGWTRRNVVLLLAGQALALGLVGGGLAAVAVWGLGMALDASDGAVSLAIAVGVAAGLGSAAVAALAPLWLAYRADAAQILRGE